MLPEMRIYTNPFDIKYILFEQSEIISDVIKKAGTWLHFNIEISKNILSHENGGTVIDVGAGIGSYSIPVSLGSSRELQFHSFEPLQVINMQLNANILLNNLGNICAHKVALGEKNEVVEAPILDISCGNHGSYSFNHDINEVRGIKENRITQKYEFRTIDSYEFVDVKLIKVSAPGMELEVFKGAAKTIQENKNPPIIFESWNNDWYAEKKKAVMEILTSMGYNHLFPMGSHYTAFKDEATFEKYTKNISRLTQEDQATKDQSLLGGFSITEQLHDTKLTLETQKVADV